MSRNPTRASARRAGPLLLAASLSLALFPTHASSQTAATSANTVNTRALARELLRDGQHALACDVLEVVYGRQSNRADVLLMQATCSRELGRDEDAVAYYRRLIEVQPDSVRARAELGALYMRMGRPDAARREFAQASKLSQQAESAELLERMVQELAPIGEPAALAQRGKYWQVEVYGGLVHDTNLNGGPSTSTIAAVIGGVPIDLTLTDDSHPIEDAGWNASVNAQYLHPLNDRWALLAQGAVSMTNYFGHSDHNNDSLAAALAFLYRKDKFSASIQPNFRLYRQQDDTDTAVYGLTMRASQALEDGWRITGSVGYLNQNVPSNDDRDAEGGLASFGFSKLLSPRVEVGAEYIVQRERANEGIYSRTLHGPVVYALGRVHEKVLLTGSYRYSDIQYDDRQAIFPHTRQDDQHIASIGVDWDISEWTTKGLRLRGQYTYIDNRSNLDAYRYDRRIFSVGVAMRF